MLQKNALVAAGYALMGWLALALAIPPGFASPLYPSAGLALAAVLSWGPRVLPGVALGAFAANLLAHLLQDSLSPVLLLVCAGIGVGAALQAGLGAALLRRLSPRPLRLDVPRELLRFFLVGGALACLVNALWSTAALWLGGLLPPRQLGLTLWTWWAGDVLGVLVGAPLVLAFIGRPRRLWRPRRLTVALPLGVATLVIGVAIGLIADRERERAAQAFERDAGWLHEQVRDGLERYLAALEALHSLARASDMESAESFRRAVEGWLEQLPGLRAMGWAAHVPAVQRGAFEARLQRQHPGYLVFDREPRPSDEAMAITHIEPLASNEAALGLNSLSVPAAREAISRSRRLRVPAASEGFLLTQDLQTPLAYEARPRYGVVLYRVVTDAPPQDEDTPPRGLVFVTLRVQDAFGPLLAQAAAGLQACLLEPGPEEAPRLLAGPAHCAGPLERAAGLHEVPLQIAGREWTLRVQAAPAYFEALHSGSARSFSVLGLFTVAMLGTFLLLFTGRTLRIEDAVRRRTAELGEEMGRRQRAQQALADSERRLREIFDTAPVGIVYVDLQGRLRRVNPRLCEIAGRDALELEALELPELVAPAQRAAAQALLAELRQGRRERQAQRLLLSHADGSERHVQLTGSLAEAAPQAGAHLVLIVEDVTERLRREEAERAREVAETANRAKSEFLSRMSHELRTPLNAMLGFAQLLASDDRAPLAPEQRQWVRHVEQAGWHLLELIGEVLDLSRVESGSLRLALAPVALAPLLDETLALVSPQARQHGVALESRLEPAAAAVSGDATRLKQILANLLSNAIKYNRPGGRAVLEAGVAEDGRVRLRVSDTGPGLSAAQQARLFQPFERLGREHSDIEGVGIGLVISQRLAQAMGGELRCDSEPGAGAVFTLLLPAAAVGEGAAAAVRGRRRLLWAGSPPADAGALHARLAQQGFELECPDAPAAARAALQQGRPDALLLDLDLPDRQALELLREIRADARLAGLRVLVVSAEARPASLAPALACGVEHCLGKPVDGEVLLALLGPRIAAAVD